MPTATCAGGSPRLPVRSVSATTRWSPIQVSPTRSSRTRHSPRVEDLPDAALVFTLPSRYVQSDLLLSTAWELFGNTPTTWARVQAVCDWVHTNITYAAGSSDATVTAM